MHRTVKSCPQHLRHAAGVITIRLVICAFNTARICLVSTQITQSRVAT